MAIDTSLFINLVTQFKDKGIKDAQKGLKGFTGTTNTLNKSLGILARRVAVFETLRRSFKGFVEDDAAARRLNQTLNNLGLSFSALGVEDYLNTLEKATAVNNDQLRPSFESLARVTGNFAQTQSLLNTALDVAAGTGQSVTTVSRALARAYAGNTTSLSRLNAGLSKATLATGNFALIQDQLNSTFSGQAQSQVNTYQGQIERLKIAFQDAGDAIGKGMVDGLRQLGGSDIQNALNLIVRTGEVIGSVFGAVAKQINFIKEIFTRKDFFGAESQLELFEKFRKIDDPANIRTAARERRKALEEENRTAAKIARNRAKDLAAQKKAQLDLKKIEQDKLRLTKAENIFDDDRISLEAALRNESLDRNEILRLELKKAIINENALRAEELTKKLKQSQNEIEALANLKLANPFEEWLNTLNAMRAALGANIPAPQGYLNITPNTSIEELAAISTETMNFADLVSRDADLALSAANAAAPSPSITINVSGTGDLSDETKKKIVDTIIDYSSVGYSTSGWYQTTGALSPI